MKKALLVTAITLGIVAAGGYWLLHAERATLPIEAGIGPTPHLPAPNRTLVPTIDIAPAVGWSGDAMPTPAPGLRVQRFADGLDHPRWLYVLPNGDVLVAESNKPTPDPAPSGAKAWVANKVMTRAGAGGASADRITLLRDADGDGRAEFRSVLLHGLRSPFGMTLVDGMLYVANADALVRVPYRDGDVEIVVPHEKLVDLPAGLNHHWTKNVVANADGSKLYVTVGSNSNVGENGMDIEEGRAMIWEYDRASGAMRPYATGLRNPNGLDWEPTTGTLWTAVNERDEIGSDLVPDYVTSVQDGGFYGWPYSWYGPHVDERVQPQKPDLVAKAIVPDYALGAHTASLGIAFATRTQLPAPFADGLFVAQHGSWNRRPKSGYKVIFVPFRDGRPSGQPIDVLTGFLDEDENARGRPVDVKADARGALLVTDDVGDVVWRVSASEE